jgi:hypothetical protein
MKQMLPLDYQNWQTDFFYESNDLKERREVEALKSRSQGFTKQRMFAAGFCWRRPTRLYFVPVKSKVNSALFIEHILAPMMLVDVPNLYGSDKDMVVLHFDSARTHTSRNTYKWLDDHGINYITRDEWMVNSPEVTPMDF